MILSCGDALIDMVPAQTVRGEAAYLPKAGGSCLNVAVAMARLGVSCGFVGGLSTDFFGQMIRERLEAAGVSLDFVSQEALKTTLAFVRLRQSDAEYLFYDTASASRSWRFVPSQFDFTGIKAVHFGSVTLIAPPSADSFVQLVQAARAHCPLSFDPNCRPGLIPNPDSYRQRMQSLAEQTDILRFSNEDFSFLYPGLTERDVIPHLLSRSTSLAVITRGKAGVTAYTRYDTLSLPAREIEAVDTIGAGDTFQAALLVGLLKAELLSREGLQRLTVESLHPVLDFALQAAAITCSREGADPPWQRELASIPLPHCGPIPA